MSHFLAMLPLRRENPKYIGRLRHDQSRFVETVAQGGSGLVLPLLQDAAEEVVAYLSFTRELKPSEIFGRHPRLYASVADVYRIKRNLIERLRRSPQVRAFLAV